MLLWRYVALLVSSMLILSTFATSIILTSQKVCFKVKVSPEEITIDVDSQCGRPKDSQRDMRNTHSEQPSHAFSQHLVYRLIQTH